MMKRACARLCQRKRFCQSKRLWQRFGCDQSGSVMPFTVLVFAGVLAAIAYSLDTTRTVHSLSQVKRATDSAAMAIGYKEAANSNESDSGELRELASHYIQFNLGLDSALKQQVDQESVQVLKSVKKSGAVTYQVSVNVVAEAPVLGAESQDKTISSTVEVMSRPTEVSLLLPNTVSESESDISALRRLGYQFAQQLIEPDDDESSGREDEKKRWLSLVPYSQSVNVYDAEDPQRIDRWASFGSLMPPELSSLFSSGQISSLADPHFPDRIAHLLCMYRGLDQGENYFWDRPPTGQFGVYYRHDLPENGSPGADPVSWVGPNPDLWPDAASAIDTRYIVADKGCPNAALLPLTNDLDKIDQRLDEMSSRFNTNYAIAMGWAAASLSPQMQGSAGWGDAELPLSFRSDDQHYKAIVMLANTTGTWFDTDSYNFSRDAQAGLSGTADARNRARQRFVDLCRSFRHRYLHFYFIGVRPGDPDDYGRVLFDQVAGPGLQICTQGKDNMHFVDATGFSSGEPYVKKALKAIAEDIRRNDYVRLIR